MKTKLFLAALAIPVMFTACSQDELVSNEGVQEVKGVAVGADLEFNVTKGGADSRLATTGWEENDIVGMAWTSDEVGAAATLLTGGKAYANHPLYYTAGSSFKSNTMMYKGSYIAYYPFNENLKTIDDLTFSVPAEQTYEDADDFFGKLIFASDTVGIQAVNAGTGTTPAITLKQLSNRLGLDLQFKNKATGMTDPITVSKVSLNTTDGSFATKVKAVIANWPDNAEENEAKSLENMVAASKYLEAVSGSVVEALTVTPATALELAEATTGALSTNQVFFNILPGFEAGTAAEIVVETNYGVVTIDADDIFAKNNNVYTTPVADLNTVLGEFTLGVGQSKMLRVLVDMSAAEVDGMTATNATEVRAIVDNWKLKGNNATALTINLAHPASYDIANEGKATAENIVLDGLDLSDIPAALTLAAADTIEFTGVTNLKATKDIEFTLSGSNRFVEFSGTTTLGNVTADAIVVAGETTVNGIVNATTKATVVADAELTIANLGSKLETATFVNAGTVNIESNGELDATTITNYVEVSASVTNLGTINVGNEESVGTLTASTLNNAANSTKLATVRFYNGTVAVSGTFNDGYYIAVASDAMTFAQAIAAGVKDIEVTGEIKFATVTANASAATIYLKEGAILNLGSQGAEINVTAVVVEESASVIGKGTLNVSDELEIKTGKSLTLGENTTIATDELAFPKGASIIGFSAATSKITYNSTTAVGGSYDDNVTIEQN